MAKSQGSVLSALSSVINEYAFSQKCQKAIKGVLFQVHPGHPRLWIGEAAEAGMYPIQQFLRTLMVRLAHTNLAQLQEEESEDSTVSSGSGNGGQQSNDTDEQSKSPSPPTPTCETVFTPGAPITTKEQLLTRIHQVLAGALVKHATEDAEKACTKYATAMQIDVDEIDAAPLAPWSDDEISHESGLVFPLLSYSLWPLTVRLMMTAVVEYMTAELVELGGDCARDAGRSCILKEDVTHTIKRDVELAAVARSLCLLGGTQSGLIPAPPTGTVTGQWQSPEQRLANLFPHTQIQLRELNRYAWYNHPAQVESVLTKFISGELPQGDPALGKLHIRPVAYLGRNQYPIQFGEGRVRNIQGVRSGRISPMVDLAFNLVAFDLIDAAGREYPLLVEFRLDNRHHGDGRFCLSVGCVVDRVTSEYVGAIEHTEQWNGKFHYRSATQHTDCRLTNYKPHGNHEPQPGTGRNEDASDEETTGDDEMPTYEIESIICVAINRICCWGSENSLTSLSRFQFMHPPAVITRFTRALYRAAFDSPQVKSTLRDDFHLPNDLLGVIGDYAPVDLPYIPLDPKMGKAPLPMSVPVPVTSESASDAASGALTGVNSSIATTVTSISTGPTVSVTPTSTVDSPSGPTAVPVTVTTGSTVSVTSVMTQMSASASASASDSIPIRISICLSSAAAKRSAAEAELADHKGTEIVTEAAAGTMTTSGYDHHGDGKLTNHGDAAAPIVAIPASGSDILECDSHSADSDSGSGAPPPNKKHKSIGETQTGVTGIISVTAAASSSSASGSVIAPSATVTAAASVTVGRLPLPMPVAPSSLPPVYVSESHSAIASSVIYPDDKWTKVVPPSALSRRFVAANGRSFNLWAMIEDTLPPATV